MNESRPNLVYIFPDQYRQQVIGFMDQDPVVTPNLDRFCEESVVFTNAASNYPVCSPYRAMLFTGKYPHSNRVITNCNSETAEYGVYLRESERCLSDILHDVGYNQGYIGKYHLDTPLEENYKYTEGKRGDGKAWDAYTPPGPRRHGFDFWHSYGCCDWHLNPHYWEGDALVHQRIEPKEWSVKHETDVAVNYILNTDGKYRDSDKPFSLFVAFNPPHTPFNQVPPQYLDYYEGKSNQELLNRPNVRLDGKGAPAGIHVKNYFAAVTGIDENFGRILNAIDEKGLKENTIVVFSADHGEMMGSQNLMHKGVWYDESLLIPFIMRWPDRLQHRQDDLLLSVPDIMPSLLGLMGLNKEIPGDIQGVDYSNAISGEDTPRPDSALYLTIPASRPEGGNRGIRTHNYTFVIQRRIDKPDTHILHDNKADPYQIKNIADENPSLVNKLNDKLLNWLDKTEDPWLEAGL
ncbi:sulfatase-like hydrolase/transferase [Candidatus Poribacteria bacterium]|nr:sulfatase-like hydrolase/transferase [Candidatus Poribacteria bacterium]